MPIRLARGGASPCLAWEIAEGVMGSRIAQASDTRVPEQQARRIPFSAGTKWKA